MQTACNPNSLNVYPCLCSLNFHCILLTMDNNQFPHPPSLSKPNLGKDNLLPNLQYTQIQLTLIQTILDFVLSGEFRN